MMTFVLWIALSAIVFITAGLVCGYCQQKGRGIGIVLMLTALLAAWIAARHSLWNNGDDRAVVFILVLVGAFIMFGHGLLLGEWLWRWLYDRACRELGEVR